MNFEFISELQIILSKNNVFMFLVTGGKAVALVLLIFNLLDKFIGKIGEENQKLLDIPNFLAMAFFILSSDWIIDLIESAFREVNVLMNLTENTQYADLDQIIEAKTSEIWDGAENWWDYVGIFFSNMEYFIFYEIAKILSVFCYIADLSVTTAYLLIRIFLIELMKIVFPIVIALSTLGYTKDLLGRWIKKYIGLFVLGLAYIGIIHFIGFVQIALMNQFTVVGSDSVAGHTQLGYLGMGILITVIVTFTVKVKLFREVTSYVSSLFS